jgi:phosphatidylglycerol---prolipoprotein diacylglyceryl transferase
MHGIPYPEINPIALQLGPLTIRWYGISYVAGILLGWYCCYLLAKKKYSTLTTRDISDFVPWATLGIVVGGRLGHVLFYGLNYYWNHPLDIFKIWQPGMSFHGGIIGMFGAMVLYCRKRHLPLTELGDVVAVGAPIGIFFGRIANFINAELYGRVTDMPWGIIFPNGGPLPRHPSQLYEATLEGIVLFLIMLTSVLALQVKTKKPGLLMGIFLIGYSTARSICELFREPEVNYGSLAEYMTYGQLLSLPLILIGLYLILRPVPHEKRST